MHPTNLFNKQLTYVDEDNVYCDLNLSRIIIKMDSTGIYSKQTGNLYSLDFFKHSDTNPELLVRNFMSNCDLLINSVYKEGLGVVHVEVMGSYGYSVKDLVAYKKGDLIVGNLTADNDLLVSVKEFKNDILKVYPNPAKDVIYIDISDEVLKATIVNLQGEIVKEYENSNVLQLQGISNGLYILVIETENTQIKTKIAVSSVK